MMLVQYNDGPFDLPRETSERSGVPALLILAVNLSCEGVLQQHQAIQCGVCELYNEYRDWSVSHLWLILSRHTRRCGVANN